MPAKNNILTPSILLLIGIGILVIALATVLRPSTSRLLRTGADLKGSCLSDPNINPVCVYNSEAECRDITGSTIDALYLGDERSRYFWIARRRCDNPPPDERFVYDTGASDVSYDRASEFCEEDTDISNVANASCTDDESTGPVLVQRRTLEDAHGQLKQLLDGVYYIECATAFLCGAPSSTPTLTPTTTPTPKNTNKSAPQNTS